MEKSLSKNLKPQKILSLTEPTISRRATIHAAQIAITDIMKNAAIAKPQLWGIFIAQLFSFYQEPLWRQRRF